MKKLVIIDGNAIIHRAYHALPPLTNRQGEPTNAVYGFSSMLLRVIADLHPAYLVVTFDTPEPTFRNKLYKEYQATRPKAEDNLVSQFAKVHKLVNDLGVTSFALPGYEADDVIGTLSKQAKNHDLETIIVTGDRDMLQLVDEKTKIYMPVKGLSESKMYGTEEVKEKYGLLSSQIADFKALTGDSADNYPGVTGIGPKTAAFLLQNFQTIDGIYTAIKKRPLPVKLSDKVITALVDGYEQAMLCKKLATIVRNAGIKFDLEKAKWHADNGKIEKVLTDLGFKSLVKRVGNPTSSQQTPGLRGIKKKDNQLGLF